MSRSKYAFSGVILSIVALLGQEGAPSAQAQGVTQARQTFAEFAAQVAREGHADAVYATGHVEPTVGFDVDLALNSFTVVLARLEDVSVEHDEFRIATAYRFQKLAILSKRSIVPTPNIGERYGSLRPSGVRPQNGRELVVYREGGTVVIEGVRLTTVIEGASPDLRVAEKYLLFLTTDETVNFGVFGLDAAGVFQVQKQRSGEEETLLGLSGVDSALARDLRNRFRNSLSLLSDYLR